MTGEVFCVRKNGAKLEEGAIDGVKQIRILSLESEKRIKFQ